MKLLILFNIINKICFGCGSDTQYVGARWKMVCNKPVYAYFEEDVKGDETQLMSYKQMRQYMDPEPTVTEYPEEAGLEKDTYSQEASVFKSEALPQTSF